MYISNLLIEKGGDSNGIVYKTNLVPKYSEHDLKGCFEMQ